MLIHHLSGGAPKRRLPGQHLPERHAKRVQVRADIDLESCELLRAGELWGPSKGSRCCNRGLSIRLIERLGQPKVDDFCRRSASLLQAHYDVAWFDVPMNELLLVHRSQTGGGLRGNFQRQLYFKAARAFDEILERFPLYKLHRIKVTAPS